MIGYLVSFCELLDHGRRRNSHSCPLVSFSMGNLALALRMSLIAQHDLPTRRLTVAF